MIDTILLIPSITWFVYHKTDRFIRTLKFFDKQLREHFADSGIWMNTRSGQPANF